MRFTLTTESPTLRLIRQGRKAVGRVVPHGAGGWVAILRGISVQHADPVEAFHEVCAREMGYNSAAALRQRNSKIRAYNNEAKRAQRARLAPVRAALASGNTRDFINELDKLLGGDR